MGMECMLVGIVSDDGIAAESPPYYGPTSRSAFSPRPPP